jgi:hypoxanthine phosphoribosyltransferase
MITVKDKQFTPYISKGEIQSRVQYMGKQISDDYASLDPLFVAVLNGSFMFAAELFKHISIPATITFVKMSSYQAMGSSGQVEQILGLEYDIRDRHVVVLEDIIETGLTLHSLIQTTKELSPASVKVATLLRKPALIKKEIIVDYVGFDIENQFVVGYGLDYDGYGRNLDSIYQVIL